MLRETQSYGIGEEMSSGDHERKTQAYGASEKRVDKGVEEDKALKDTIGDLETSEYGALTPDEISKFQTDEATEKKESPMAEKPKWGLDELRQKKENILKNTKTVLGAARNVQEAVDTLRLSSEYFLYQYKHYRDDAGAREEINEIVDGLQSLQNMTENQFERYQSDNEWSWKVPKKITQEVKDGKTEKTIKIPGTLAALRNEIRSNLAFIEEREGIESTESVEDLKKARDTYENKLKNNIEPQYSEIQRLLQEFDEETIKKWNRKIGKEDIVNDVYRHLIRNPDSKIFKSLESTLGEKAEGRDEIIAKKAARYTSEFTNRYFSLNNTRSDLNRKIEDLNHLIEVKEKENKKGEG